MTAPVQENIDEINAQVALLGVPYAFLPGEDGQGTDGGPNIQRVKDVFQRIAAREDDQPPTGGKQHLNACLVRRLSRDRPSSRDRCTTRMSRAHYGRDEG